MTWRILVLITFLILFKGNIKDVFWLINNIILVFVNLEDCLCFLNRSGIFLITIDYNVLFFNSCFLLQLNIPLVLFNQPLAWLLSNSLLPKLLTLFCQCFFHNLALDIVTCFFVSNYYCGPYYLFDMIFWILADWSPQLWIWKFRLIRVWEGISSWSWKCFEFVWISFRKETKLCYFFKAWKMLVAFELHLV